jgi:hypothetical protein
MISSTRAPSARVFTASLLALVLGVGMYFDFAASNGVPDQSAAALAGELANASASPDVRRLAQWTVSTQDHGGMPFIVIDKAGGRIYAFDPRGRLRGSAPVVSTAQADVATPPGRFEANHFASARGARIVWTHGQAQLALYAAPAEPAGEQAPARVEDRRMPDGSLQVGAGFYRECLDGLRTQPSIAYVLPETGSLERVFGMGAGHPPEVVQQAEGTRRPS